MSSPDPVFKSEPPSPAQGSAVAAGWLTRWRSPTVLVALGGLLALLVPVLVYGPWLPLIDLVSFVGMDAYPPQLSYGPVHFYTFQFTYIGHYALSRLLCDLRVGVPYQIQLLYLLEAVTCFVIVWRSLERLIANPWWRACGVALGTLAFWDGIFLWGGPLAYSLAATSLSAAMFLAMREAGEPERNSRTAITLFTFWAIICHPFAAAFALILCGLRFLFVRRQRLHSVLLAAGVLLFSWVILRDSPPTEAHGAAGLKLLFGFDRQQLWLRCWSLFHVDRLFVQTLFGTAPFTTQALFLLLTGLHILGFLVAPVLIFQRGTRPWLRMLATLNLVVGLLYLFSWDTPHPLIPEWPQRILTLYAPFTYLGGFVALTFLLQRLPRRPRLSSVPALGWALPVALLCFMVSVQAQIFRFGRGIETNFAGIRDDLVRSGLNNACVVVSGMDAVKPFYLRCIPFLLFSDPQVINRHITLATEWHFQDRHPSRLVETQLDLGRPWYSAEFSTRGAALAMKLVAVPKSRFPVPAGTNLISWGDASSLGRRQYEEASALLAAGYYSSALEHFNSVINLLPKEAGAWNDAGVALRRMGDDDKALLYFSTAVERDPKLVSARINLGSVLLAKGRPLEALPQLEEAFRLQPDEPNIAPLLEAARTAAAATKLVLPGTNPR